MKKKLDIASVASSLRGESVFFPKNEPVEQIHASHPPSQPVSSSIYDTVIPRHHDTNHDTVIPRNHDTTNSAEDEMIEEVRKAVRQIGKEPATQRLTLEEKQALDDIEYSYKRQGIRTSGNEIIRIATNYVVREYRQNGANSILAKVLQKLNS